MHEQIHCEFFCFEFGGRDSRSSVGDCGWAALPRFYLPSGSNETSLLIHTRFSQIETSICGVFSSQGSKRLGNCWRVANMRLIFQGDQQTDEVVV